MLQMLQMLLAALLRLRLQTHAHGNTAATHQIFVKATLNI